MEILMNSRGRAMGISRDGRRWGLAYPSSSSKIRLHVDDADWQYGKVMNKNDANGEMHYILYGFAYSIEEVQSM